MKKISIVLLSLIIGSSLFAESNFKLSLETDAVIGGLALGSFGLPYILSENIGAQQPKDEINGIDALFINNYNEDIDFAATLITYGLLVAPGITVLDRFDEGDTLLTYGAMYAESFFLATGLKDSIKAVVNRWRPYTYSSSFSTTGDDDYYNSFPSGHTLYAFMSATFIATTMMIDMPDSPYTIPCIIGAYTLATAVSAFRVASGEHFILDVTAGAALGALIGWAVPILHYQQNDKIAMAPSASSQGVGFELTFRF